MMKPEDRYAAGLAGGAGLGAAGYAAFRSGGSMAAAGRAQARENAGSRGMATRGGRLIRAGADMQRESARGLGNFRRIETPKGVRYMDAGKWAKSKKLTDQAQLGEKVFGQGKELAGQAPGRRSAAVEGIKRFKAGRVVRRGGLAAMAAGGAVAAGSLAAGERYQNKRRGELRRVAPAMPVPSADDYRARAGSMQGGLLQNAAGQRNFIPNRRNTPNAKQRAYLERTGLVNDGASDQELADALRRARLNGR